MALTIITCRLIFYPLTYFRLSLAQQARATTQSAVGQNRSQCGTLSVFCWWTASLTFVPIRWHILSFCCWRWKCIHTGMSFYCNVLLPLVSNWICCHKVHGTNLHNSQNALPSTQDRIPHASWCCKTTFPPEGATICLVTKWGSAKELLIESFTTRRGKIPAGQEPQISTVALAVR